MKLTIGFSPCPNDTFIFDALVNGKIDTGELEFEPVVEDVETLNQWAMDGRLTITKLSYGVLPLALDKYAVLDSGSALGRGVGPLLVCNQDYNISVKDDDVAIAIPGEHTTAHALFMLAYPEKKNKVFMRYDQIEQFVLDGKGLGLIIHENRFTYRDRGLEKVRDLGEFWEEQVSLPIPLGGIVMRKDGSPAMKKQIDKLIRNSIEYAWSQYPLLSDFVTVHAREMDESVIRKHIRLYVNEYSLNLGVDGRNAVEKLLEITGKLKGEELLPENIFV